MRIVRATFARLRRLHPFTWCVVVLAGAMMVLIVVPGMEADRDETSRWYSISRKQLYWATAAKYETQARQANTSHSMTIWVADHGWPLPYMLRSLGSFDTVTVGGAKQSRTWSKPALAYAGTTTGTKTGAPLEVAWSNRDNWPLESEFYHFRLGYLLVDLLAALVVIAMIAALAEGWIRWRGGLFRFRILDLLIVITGCSVFLAWYYHHLRISEKEDEVVQSVTTETWIRGAEKSYAGPQWLARLVGNRERLCFLHHYDSVAWHHSKAVQSFDQWQQEFDAVRRLKYLRSVTLPQDVPLELVAELAEEHRLKEMNFEFHTVDARQFEAGKAPSIQAHELELLAPIGIRHLGLAGANVLESDIRTAAGSPFTSRLSLHDVSATLDDIQAIRAQHPDVEILATWGPYRTKEPSSESAQKRIVRRNVEARQQARSEAERLATVTEGSTDEEEETPLPDGVFDELRRVTEGQSPEDPEPEAMP